MGDNTTTRSDKVNGLTNGEAKCPADHSQFPLYEADRKAKSTECTYTTSNGVPMPRKSWQLAEFPVNLVRQLTLMSLSPPIFRPLRGPAIWPERTFVAPGLSLD